MDFETKKKALEMVFCFIGGCIVVMFFFFIKAQIQLSRKLLKELHEKN